jgi:hypothetical protein
MMRPSACRRRRPTCPTSKEAEEESLRERSSDGLQRALPTATLRFTCEVLLVATSSKKYRGSYVADRQTSSLQAATKFGRMRLASRKYRVVARETLPKLAKIVAEA